MPGHSVICMVWCTCVDIQSVDRYQMNTGVLYISVQISQSKQKATETKERSTLKEPKQSKTYVELLDQEHNIAGCKQCSNNLLLLCSTPCWETKPCTRFSKKYDFIKEISTVIRFASYKKQKHCLLHPSCLVLGSAT